MRAKDYYRERIIEMVRQISRCDVLLRIYRFTSDVLEYLTDEE